MSHPKPEKVAEVEELERQLRLSPVVILTDYRGLSVGEIGTLRSRLGEASLVYRVAKNTLLGRAAEQAGVSGLDPYLVGPTAVLFGRDDPGVPARILQEFIRQYRKLEIKGGVIEGQVLGPEGIQALASLPGKRELLAQFLGVLQAPLRGLVTVLTGPQRGLVTALDAVRKRREEAGEPVPAEALPAAAGPRDEPALAADAATGAPAAQGSAEGAGEGVAAAQADSHAGTGTGDSAATPDSAAAAPADPAQGTATEAERATS